MLIERWERFKGYDRWPEVEASIEWEDSWGPPSGGAQGGDGSYIPVRGFRAVIKRFHVQYHGIDGSRHTGNVWAFCGLGISALRPGDRLYVRCSPENPNRIYLRSQTTGMFVFVTLLGLTGLLIWAVQYLNSR